MKSYPGGNYSSFIFRVGVGGVFSCSAWLTVLYKSRSGFPSGRLDIVRVRLYRFYRGRLVIKESSSVLNHWAE